MITIFDILFPSRADNMLRGSQWPLYLLGLVASVGVIRSLIHIFAPDGGAGSIAGIDLSDPGANAVVFAFALWGTEQLVYAFLQWLVILRYRSLVPLMWVVQIIETCGRILPGRIKPVTFLHTPPGAYQNYIYLALGIAMLALSLASARRAVKENAG